MTEPAEIVCTGLAKSFGATEVVRPTDLAFAAGQTTALVGPSGCGKSTLLRLVAGLETPSAGEVSIAGAPPAETLRQGALSMAFQDPSLLPWRTVRGNVTLALKLARQPVDAEAISRLIELVGLGGFGDTRPAALSGGMRQRAAIARAMVTRPRVLLLDEPFGAVDELTRQQLAEDLPPLWEARGATTLLVTHSVSEAVMLSDRVLVFSGRPARVVADIAVPLDRPRRASLSTDPAFLARTSEVSEALAAGMAETRPRLAAQ
ncbi:ABC transporter ATP-binding protein [Roseivivax sediminis]|uniref:NitT/TauT family transport system ATP-binding protein n=1 Tax=Roseivivax sediminis TaxID=936889 RepID=A0A1I2DIL0_9RHOB|nr:ABC transporter ATP-binding protein [Roseivivax sediminis]SFE80374.1 NitT/TauT family transport system ATP-binding protein [Roseivivax sediminis]